MQDTADSAGDSAEELEGFSQRFSGALSAAVAGLGVAAGGLLSQVPVIGELMEGLFAIVEAVAFQMDSVLRPALSGVTDFLFDIADAIFDADGGFGDIIGTLATIGGAAGILLGVLKLLGVALTGPLLAGIALVAGAIAALWLAWRENFGGIRDVAQDTIDNVSERFSDFVDTVKPIVMGFLDTLESVWDSHGDTIMDVVNFAFRTIGAVIETVIDSILTTIEIALQILSGDWEGAWESLTDFWSRLLDRWAPLLSEAIDAVIDLMLDLASDLASWADDLADDAFDWGRDIITRFIGGLESMVGVVREVLEDMPFIGQILSLFDRITDALDDIELSGSAQANISQSLSGAFGGGGGGGNSGRASSRPRFGAATSGGSGGSQIDGRQITESTGRYRSGSPNRRGL